MNETVIKCILSLQDDFLLEMYKFCNEMYFDYYVNGNEEYANKYKGMINNIDGELRKRGVWKSK